MKRRGFFKKALAGMAAVAGGWFVTGKAKAKVDLDTSDFDLVKDLIPVTTKPPPVSRAWCTWWCPCDKPYLGTIGRKWPKVDYVKASRIATGQDPLPDDVLRKERERIDALMTIQEEHGLPVQEFARWLFTGVSVEDARRFVETPEMHTECDGHIWCRYPYPCPLAWWDWDKHAMALAKGLKKGAGEVPFQLEKYAKRFGIKRPKTH